jgi:plasmid maintenance system killer protein
MLKLESLGTKGVKMIIKNLAAMEKIVAKNSNLKWVGWDVLELKKSNLGRTDANGIRINDQWYIKKTFSPSRSGWEIPGKYKE